MLTLDLINEYWLVLTTVIAVIVSYVRLEFIVKSERNKRNSLEHELEEVKREQKSNSLEFKKIEISIEGVRADVAFIKDILSRKSYDK